jgi:hypothetical protein
MLWIIGAIFVCIGIVGMILNTPRALKLAFETGIPPSYSIFITILIVMFWTFSFFAFGFNVKLTIGYIGILSFFWALTYKYLKNH